MAIFPTETEYLALPVVFIYIILLFCLLDESNIFIISQAPLYCDEVLILVFHARAKHIVIDYHFICKFITSKTILIHYVTSQYQIADIFTIGLTTTCFIQIHDKLMLFNGTPILTWDDNYTY